MMKEVAVPPNKRQYYREFLREAKAFDTLKGFREVARRFSPLLKGELMLFFSSSWTQKVSYLSDAPERLIMDIANEMNPEFFSRKEPLHGTTGCLCVVERGTLACNGVILMPGSAFQEDFIVTNPYLRKHRPVVSLTYSLILMLDRDKFLDIVAEFPQFGIKIKKAAIRIALLRAIVLSARKQRRDSDGTESHDKSSWPSLSSVFEALA